jgi:hypothetical protein
LVKTGADGEGHCTDVIEIIRPADLSDIADLGLALADAKLLLAGLQQAIVTGQARDHAARRPACRRCGEACHVKDYRDRGVATLFGRVTVRLPRFRCAACGGIEAGIGWPSHCRSTPEMDQLQAHLCVLMTYRTAAGVLEQMFPVDAGEHPENLAPPHPENRRGAAELSPGQARNGGAGNHGELGFNLHPELCGRRAAS